METFVRCRICAPYRGKARTCHLQMPQCSVAYGAVLERQLLHFESLLFQKPQQASVALQVRGPYGDERIFADLVAQQHL